MNRTWSSLTKLYQPEYDRQVDVVMRLGLAPENWRVPELRVYRSRRHGPDGLATPRQITIYLRSNTWSLGAIHQTMAHELAHTLTWDESESHGPQFRAALRRIAEARWPDISEVQIPNIEGWRRADQHNFEDAWMTMAIDKLYGDANRLPRPF